MIVKPKQYGITKEDNIKQFVVCVDQTSEISYPTMIDCSPGSTMLVVDNVNHRITSSLFFDGQNWNSMSSSNEAAFGDFLLALNGEVFV